MNRKFKILETYRIKLDMTYNEMAGQIGVGTSTLHNIIHGHNQPNARNMHKIEKWLNKQTLVE